MECLKTNKVLMAIATHKDFNFPDDDCYLPIHAGKALSSQSLGFLGDDTGENISIKNQSYCELTVLFWVWKNMEAKYIGLSHYRRYFKSKVNVCNCNNKSVMVSNEIQNMMEKYDIILPQKRRYYIENIYTHYCNMHYEEDLITLRSVVSKKHPDYSPFFNKFMKSRSLHLFNMFIMRWELFDEYMQWLFSILFEFEEQADLEKYPNSYQKRVFGFLAERLLNIWVYKHENDYKKITWPIIEIGGESFLQKVINLIGRKVGYTPLKKVR